ncbi:MAG: YscO family type III secretion system apparatus protein [Kiritimatiellae bacterium]|nr:YscO family type III secretion system apparatus protein [Kiritimatiellia bacterium]
MGYALQSLLRIRVMREDRAAGEMTAARQVVIAAQETLEARRRDLSQYEATREERRDRIYDAVIGHAVTRDQLELAKEGVARIDEEGILKADNVRQAEADLHKSEEAEAAARERFNLATKNRMKIDEHRAAWQMVQLKEEEARAEGELEDFTVRKTDDD